MCAHVLIATSGCASAGPDGQSEKEAPRAADRPAVAIDANAIVKAMKDRYASCKTYQDKGKQTLTMTPDDGTEPSKVSNEFETKFDRARDGFFFRYTKTYARFFSPSGGAIWREAAGAVRVWTVARGSTSEMELPNAIYALTGVSSGTSRVVPTMLMPDVEHHALPPLSYDAAGEEAVDGVACFKLMAHREDRDVTVWIAKSDSSLRRYFQRVRIVPAERPQDLSDMIARIPPEKRTPELLEVIRKPVPFVSEQTTDYVPVFDGEIDPARFKFTPPPSDAAHEP
jgi:hypothetical protein